MTTAPAPTRLARKPAAHTTQDWRTSAACREVDPDLHFPVAHTPGWRTQTAEAKKVCRRCPVREACLEWAVATRQPAGVWGGLAEGERKEMFHRAETQAERCWDNQVWIEEQLADGTSQSAIARRLGVSRTVLSRVIPQFAAERAYVEGQVKAA